MKKLLTFSVLFIAFISNAQSKMKVHNYGNDTFYFPFDSSLTYCKTGKNVTTYKMPNALQGFNDNQQLVGNNGNGFNTYKSQVDGMAVVKPDANNATSLSKMPVVKIGNDQSTTTYPISNEILNQLLLKKKEQPKSTKVKPDFKKFKFKMDEPSKN